MSSRPTRRWMLRGAGGVVLGLPWLELTAGRVSRAEAAPPKRLLVISVGHSVDVARGTNSWLPPAPDLSQLSPLLEPLAPHRSKVMVVSGIDNVVGAANLVPSNGHNFTSRSLLTCMPTQEALDGAGNLRANVPECKPASLAGGPSLEYALARAWNDEVVNLRIGEAPGEHARSFRVDGTHDAGNPNPQAAFDRLFKARAGTPTTPEERLRAKRTSVLDAVRDSFVRVQAKAGVEDRARLARHAEHIRQFELGLDRVVKIVCDDPKLTLSRPLPAAFEQGEGRADDIIAAAQIEVAVAAFACQASRVAHLHFSNVQGNTFPWLNDGKDLTTEGWHGTVHMDRGTDDQRLRPMRWYMKVLADAVTRLDQTREEEGTLLDSTLVLWISSLRTNAHGTEDLPVVVAGSLKGKLKTGQHLRYASRRSLGDLYTTILGALDVSTSAFGWNKGTAMGGRPFCSGPLPGWT